MSSSILTVRELALPWEGARPDRRVLHKWLGICLSVVLVGGVLIPWITLPEAPREELETLPPQLARIVLDKPEPKIPPPPPPKAVEEVQPKEKPKPVEKKEETVVKAEPTVADAKEKAAVSGLLQFQDAFADMREAVDVSKLQDTGAIARGAGEAAKVDRAILTSKQSTRSIVDVA